MNWTRIKINRSKRKMFKILARRMLQIGSISVESFRFSVPIGRDLQVNRLIENSDLDQPIVFVEFDIDVHFMPTKFVRFSSPREQWRLEIGDFVEIKRCRTTHFKNLSRIR